MAQGEHIVKVAISVGLGTDILDPNERFQTAAHSIEETSDVDCVMDIGNRFGNAVADVLTGLLSRRSELDREAILEGFKEQLEERINYELLKLRKDKAVVAVPSKPETKKADEQIPPEFSDVTDHYSLVTVLDRIQVQINSCRHSRNVHFAARLYSFLRGPYSSISVFSDTERSTVWCNGQKK